MVKSKNILAKEADAGLIILSKIKGLSINCGTVNTINFEAKSEKFISQDNVLLAFPFYVLANSTLVAKFDGRKKYLLPDIAGYIIFTKDSAKKIIGFKRYRAEVSTTRSNQVLSAAQSIINTINLEVEKDLSYQQL